MNDRLTESQLYLYLVHNGFGRICDNVVEAGEAVSVCLLKASLHHVH